MKNITKYLFWLPFGVAIGAFALYLRYIITIKTNSNVIVTEAVSNTLNTYLIITFIALFIGLLLVFLKKIINLNDNSVKDYKENIELGENYRKVIENKSINTINYEKKKSNFISDIQNNDIVRIKLSNPIIDNIVKGTIESSNKDINLKLSDSDVNYIKDKKECPKCKNIVDKEAVICVHCGILLDESLRNKEKVVIQETKVKDKTNNKFKIPKFLVNIFIIILCIFLIFLIGNKILNQREINMKNINVSMNINES